MLNPKDNPVRTEMLIYSFVCLTLVIIGIVGAISYKLDEDIEVLIFSLAALMSGLGVALAGSLRKDLYDHLTAIENLLQR
jgi:F0F1-type ATP synthase membrane subunit c/vacuolar-type H+-ATPase subunit K